MLRRNKAKRMLIEEIRRTFNYTYDDAEKYADYLKSKAFKEYTEAFNEMTITKDKNIFK